MSRDNIKESKWAETCKKRAKTVYTHRRWIWLWSRARYANAHVPSLWLGRPSSHDGCPRGRSSSCCSCRRSSCRPSCRCPIRFWLESLRSQCPSSCAASSGIIILCETNLVLARRVEGNFSFLCSSSLNFSSQCQWCLPRSSRGGRILCQRWLSRQPTESSCIIDSTHSIYSLHRKRR